METTNRALLTNQAMHIMYHSSVGILHLNLSKQKRNGIGDSTIYKTRGQFGRRFFFPVKPNTVFSIITGSLIFSVFFTLLCGILSVTPLDSQTG